MPVKDAASVTVHSTWGAVKARAAQAAVRTWLPVRLVVSISPKVMRNLRMEGSAPLFCLT